MSIQTQNENALRVENNPRVGIGGSKLGAKTSSAATQATDQIESPMSAVARTTLKDVQNVATQSTYNPTLPTEIPLNTIWREEVQVRLVHVDNSIENLAKSIEKIGLQQPIVLRRKINPNNPIQTYCIVAGHTRFAAYQLLNKQHQSGSFSRIPAIKVEVTDHQLLTMQFAENEERYELLPIEIGRALTILFNECKEDNPILDEKEFVLSKHSKYHEHYASMIRSMNALSIHNEISTLEWFGNINIKCATITNTLLKLLDRLMSEEKIKSFEDFKQFIEDEQKKQKFTELNQKNIPKIVSAINENVLGITKKVRAKKDPDIVNLSDMNDYKAIVTNGSIDSLGATIGYSMKSCKKQDIGALLKALGERIGEDELSEMLYTHLHK